jgi:endonuclease/exonuclease/phosphatase family metal-dependent hydrolase
MRQILLIASLFIYLILTPGGAFSQSKSKEVQNKNVIKVLTYNVRNCRGLDKKTDYQRIADIINKIDPDVVALQEIDSATLRSGKIVVLGELAIRTNLHPTFGASISYQGGKYGIGVLSKEKPVGWKSIPLPGREESRSLLIVEFQDYFFCSTHFSLNEEDRLKSVEIINSLFISYEKPVFLAGDLNADPGSDVVITLEPAWSILNNKTVPTIPADNPKRCIDYILALKSNYNRYIVEENMVEAEAVASDHLPVWTRIRIER